MTMTTTQMWGVAEVGALFDVAGHTVDVWFRRYDTCPQPDVVIGSTRPIKGWNPSREQEWRDWHASRAGAGAGGGRRSSGVQFLIDRFADMPVDTARTLIAEADEAHKAGAVDTRGEFVREQRDGLGGLELQIKYRVSKQDDGSYVVTELDREQRGE